MKQVYSASDSTEAHMLLHLLEQHGIKAFIHGEMLQGAVGELPVDNYIKITVADEDYEQARKILVEWERRHPPQKDNASPSTRGNPMFLIVTGLVIAVIIAYVANSQFSNDNFSNAPFTEEKDKNNDGKVDTIFYYDHGAGMYPTRLEDDTNFDGKFDFILQYDTEGNAVSDQIDMNFDGTFDVISQYEYGLKKLEKEDQDYDGYFETMVFYKNGALSTMEVDIDGDGKKDMTHIYEHGTLMHTHFYDVKTGILVKINAYKNGHLISAKLDSDRDGSFDTIYTYDRYEEIVKVEKVK